MFSVLRNIAALKLTFLFGWLMVYQSFATTAVAKERSEKPFVVDNTFQVTLDSELLGRKYDLFFKLPRGYSRASNAEKAYPVLYLNDAPHTFKVAAGVTHFPAMDKAIVVAIGFAHGEHGQHSRVRDLTPVEDPSWVKYKTGGGGAYLDFIKREVIPYVEQHYRADSSKRILSGHSLGGSFGAWVMLKEPSLFSAYILSSPSFWYKDEWIMKLQQQHAKKQNTINAKVFIATGGLETIENGLRNDMVKGHKKFVSQLRRSQHNGLTLQDEVIKGTDHYSTFPVALSKGLVFLFSKEQ